MLNDFHVPLGMVPVVVSTEYVRNPQFHHICSTQHNRCITRVDYNASGQIRVAKGGGSGNYVCIVILQDTNWYHIHHADIHNTGGCVSSVGGGKVL